MGVAIKREPGPTERAYQQLRNDLISQEFDLGEKLMINALADQYHVSSTPVREALSRLHGEQLISFQPGQGYYYKIPSLPELQDLIGLLETLLLDALRSEAFSTNASNGMSWRPEDLAEFRNLESEIYSDSTWAYDLEILWEEISRMSSNAAAFQVVRNIIARTHFVRIQAMENYNSEKWIDESVKSLCSALTLGEFVKAQGIVSTYLERELTELPEILRDLISDPYLSKSALRYNLR